MLTDFECFCNVSHIHVIHIHIINAHIHIQTRFPNDGDQNAKVSSHACYSSKLTFSIQISDHLHDFNRRLITCRFNYIQSNEQERREPTRVILRAVFPLPRLMSGQIGGERIWKRKAKGFESVWMTFANAHFASSTSSRGNLSE